MVLREGMLMRQKTLIDSGCSYLDVKLGEGRQFNGEVYFPIIYDDLSGCILSESEILYDFVEVV